LQSKLERTRLCKGVHLGTVSDPKFKHNRITASFILPLDEKKASDRAAVPYILRMAPRAYPDFSALNAKLQELYGASLEACVAKFGGYQVLDVSVRALDNRYALSGEDLTAVACELLTQIWLDPKLENGIFEDKNTALQRKFVQDAIEAEINEKRHYAISQCLQVMCGGEPVAVKVYGYPDTAAAITPDSATAAYQEILRGAQVEIIFTGAGDSNIAKKVFTDAFGKMERPNEGYSPVKLKHFADRVQEKTERMELSQSKLVMGMRCGEIKSREELNAARLFAALYGGTPFSKLFKNVREKLSLCYYCAARFDPSTRLLLVDSGVEAENKQKAQDEIMLQLKNIADGEVGQDELAETKMLLSNSILTMTDSPSSLEGWYMAQILRGEDILSPKEDIKALMDITKDQLVEAAQKVTLDTIYFLTGEGAQ
jgi:predicted Zn-dependent peptidase